jgi:hypothetical protein
MIDGRECVIQSDQTTESVIVCVTSDKPFIEGDEPRLDILIDGKGLVATKGKIFFYAQRWSDTQTWGGLAPLEGEAVFVPKGMHLIVDIETTPTLSLVLVEGSMIFDQDVATSFNVDIILVKNGYLEIGTEDDPYCNSDLTITMTGGTEFGGESIPIFGNKVLAVHGGLLEIHGCPRQRYWTELESTALVEATSIILTETPDGQVFDWEAGDEIVIASTDYDAHHAETRIISSVANTGPGELPEVFFDKPLEFKHFADEKDYDGVVLEMRAEVGLLTRNVKF